MRILQITKKFPWPAKDGEIIGIINLTRGFAELGHQVTVLALNTKKHYFPVDQLPADIKSKAIFEAVDIDTAIKPMQAFKNLFSSKSYNVERFYSKVFEQRLITLLQSQPFDLILVESIYMMRYIDAIRRHSHAKVALRPQNVEYVIWQRLADHEKDYLKKSYLQLLSKRMRSFELENINKADVLIPLSDIDEKIFIKEGCTIPGKAFPIGFIFDATITGVKAENETVGFIGGLDWKPNQEGVDWFLKDVWPDIIHQNSDAQFKIAGRNMPEKYKKLSIKGVRVLGEVDSANDFINACSVFIVPLLSGSGMRVKIVEAMAQSAAIVSTSVGAESLYYKDGETILIADDAQRFGNAINALLKNKDERNRLGSNARKMVEDHYNNKVICQSIINFIKPLMGS